MFRRVLIANRGEIAVRVIRACRELGITSIAAYSEADRDSLPVQLADESICIGPAPSKESYLKIPSIVAAAEVCDAQAIHPGYGFLAENERFAAICRECNITFIGPSPETIALGGDKAACRAKAKEAGVPIVPGSDGMVHEPDEAMRIAREIGFPVMVKASAGGGGKGMRLAHTEASLKNAISVAQTEAEAAFGFGGVYLEKYIGNARHVEIQVMADHHGRTVALGERECTIQRRHQKLIEESPSPVLSSTVRARMCKAAVRAAKAIGYTNAGTAEFLLAPDLQHFYFIEFNTRIQVEHPVTEEVTGHDLVKEQILVAAGEPLPYHSVRSQGHAIEARIYAEDPDNKFMPSPGRIGRFHIPGGPGIRVETHCFAGYEVPRFYDSTMAKIIARGRDRQEAIDRIVRALDEFASENIVNTARLCARVIGSERFRRGELAPDMLDSFLPRGSG